jgi:DNA repair protein RAD50
MSTSRAPTQIQDDIKQVNVEIKSGTSQKEDLRSNKERMQNKISSLEIETLNERAKLATASQSLKDKTTLASRISEYKSDNERQQTSIKRFQDEIQSLLPQISQTQKRLDDIVQRGATKEQELQAELSRTKDSIGRLELASKDINEFISRGGPEALARGTREMESIQADLERLEKQVTQVGRNANEVQEELQNNDNTKRAIADNLTYRENIKMLTTLKEEIAKLESSNSLADKVRYEKDGDEWQIKRNELTADQASIMGRLKSKDDQLQGLLAEWEADYKDAAYKFKEAHVKVEVTKAAIEDLARYAGALDKAIMKYHSLKMEEINSIIAELWRRTYKGSDVDTIMIRSENENTRGNKSYNYRVVMVKQNTEMDMRGRCSAGQKVLASIIIRLALAECFSVNCGMIALDEPTTNLDRDNIISLARSLHDLIKLRRKQKNFQLIVITHDEEFLKHMNCAELTDDYFRVYRDARQKSQIRSQKISQIYQ